jgi:hypothetical protein
MTEQRPTSRYRPRHAPHPIEPLIERTGATDLQHLARLLGISDRWARELKATGLTDTQADRYACRIGYHPSILWPTWLNIEPDLDEGPDGIMRDRAS